MKTPVTVAPEALDFPQLIRVGETIGWAEATAEPVLFGSSRRSFVDKRENRRGSSSSGSRTISGGVATC